MSEDEIDSEHTSKVVPQPNWRGYDTLDDRCRGFK
jgi:hypothetical protein